MGGCFSENELGSSDLMHGLKISSEAWVVGSERRAQVSWEFLNNLKD